MSAFSAYSLGFIVCLLIVAGVQILVHPGRINERLDSLEWQLSELTDRLDGIEDWKVLDGDDQDDPEDWDWDDAEDWDDDDSEDADDPA